MNITQKEAIILGQLAARAGSEMYGLEMVNASNGELKLGTVYVTLGRLEEKGFVKGHKEDASARTVPRRLYQITGAGMKTFQAWSAAMAAYNLGIAGVMA